MSIASLRPGWCRYLGPALVLVFGLVAGAASVRAGEGPAAASSDTGTSGARPFRIVMVVWRGATRVEDGFRAYLSENHIPSEIIVRDVNRDPARLPALVAEIRELKPDLVYSWGTTVTLGLVGPWNHPDPALYLTKIPVIFTLVADPVGAGIVERLDRPRANVTGTSFLAPLDAQIRAIRSYRPFSRLAVLYNPLESNSVLNVNELRAAGTRLGFTVVEKPVPVTADNKPNASAVPRLVAEAKQSGAEFLYIGPDSFTAVVSGPLTEAAIEQRLPTFAATELPLRQAKAMFGLVSNYYTLGRFTAYKAEQILRYGKAPGDIPVETMTRFSFMLRMGVATDVKMYPPLNVVRYADVVDREDSEGPDLERRP